MFVSRHAEGDTLREAAVRQIVGDVAHALVYCTSPCYATESESGVVVLVCTPV